MSSPTPNGPPRPTPTMDKAEAPLRDQLRRLVAPKQVQHAIVAIQSIDGTFRWVGAEGAANPDGTPMRAETPFWIASVTKLYIAAAIWRLHEQGKLAVEERMAAYLPTSLIGGLHRLEGVDHTDEITLLHLLGHSSGLPDYLDGKMEGDKSLLDSLSEDTELTFDLERALQLVRDTLTPHFPPQPLDARKVKSQYSDTNYQLLIAIIEAVTGEPLHSAFEALLFEPLGLEHTFVPGHGPADLPAPMATVWAGNQALERWRALGSFRDLVSTADDLLAFMRALIRGDLFEEPRTLNRMRGNWKRWAFSLNPTRMGWPIEYGLGMMRMQMPRIFSPFRALPSIVGHTGISGSWLFYSPELDVVTAGTVDQLTAGAVPFRSVPRLLGVVEGLL